MIKVSPDLLAARKAHNMEEALGILFGIVKGPTMLVSKGHLPELLAGKRRSGVGREFRTLIFDDIDMKDVSAHWLEEFGGDHFVYFNYSGAPFIIESQLYRTLVRDWHLSHFINILGFSDEGFERTKMRGHVLRENCHVLIFSRNEKIEC